MPETPRYPTYFHYELSENTIEFLNLALVESARRIRKANQDGWTLEVTMASGRTLTFPGDEIGERLLTVFQAATVVWQTE